jgi:hypothetical protein
VGALLYFMLTGKPPFDAATVPQLYMRICVEPPPPLLARRPDVPEPLDRAIRRAMCKHPEDRFSTSAALRAALAPFADAQFDRPSHFEGAGFSSEPAATSSSSSETSRQVTPAALETALERELAQLTPRLPERRWRRPFLAVSLVFAGLFSMGWGAWALTPAEKPELARKVSATPRAQQDLPALPAAAAPAALVEEAPATTTHAPQAAKPRVRAQSEARNSEREPIAQQPESAAAPVSARAPEGALRPHVAEPLPEASEPSLPISARAPEGALRPGPANQAADAVFRFPRRALKPVF